MDTIFTASSGQNKKSKHERGHDIDSKHPLLVNDPIIAYMEEDHNCLHWMAKGYCGYKDSGKCRFAHPSEFDIKNFLCPQLNKGKECGRVGNCAYCHDRKLIPCKEFYTINRCRQGMIGNCLFSHDISQAEYEQYKQIKMKKSQAFQQWMQNKNERNDQVSNAESNSGSNRSIETITTSFDSAQLTSALID